MKNNHIIWAKSVRRINRDLWEGINLIQKLSIAILLFLLFGNIDICAQALGGNPPSIEWDQINTDTVRVIFPMGLKAQAEQVANTVTYLNRHNRRSIGDKQKKINIVLQNQTVIPNGYVGLAPFRSEFYLTPPQSAYEVGPDWLNQLSIHEYRHALQYMNTRTGITDLVSYLFGQFAWNFMTNLSIPNWYWEGDAIMNETVLTDQGRGRMPFFYNGYKSLFYSDNIYSYAKARNGSMQDYVPDHYEFGFLMCNYGRAQYGNDMWKDVLRDASRYRTLFYPFSGALRKHTGNNVHQFYQEAMQYYGRRWNAQQDSIAPVSLDQFNRKPRNNTYTSYRYPYFDGKGDVIAYKSSYKQIAGIYHIMADGQENLICRQGLMLDYYFSFRNHKLAWAEMGYDERWSWQIYSNIVTYNLETGKRTKLTHQEKYFSPDLSHNGDRIVAFHSTPDLQYAIHILDAETGQVIQEIPNPENDYFSYPRWSQHDHKIIALLRKDKGDMAVVAIDINTGVYDLLTTLSKNLIDKPYVAGNFVLFTASYGGEDNIFAVKPGDTNVYQVSDRILGAYDVNVDPDQKTIIFSEFSHLGYNLKTMPFNPGSWKKIQITSPTQVSQFQFNAEKDEGGNILDKVHDHEYPVEQYPLSKGLINIHSWSLFFADPNYEFSLLSNNVLNTLQLQLGARYNRNDRNITYFLDAQYGQYYPLFTLSTNVAQYASDRFIVDNHNQVLDTVSLHRLETVITPGIMLPFKFNYGTYSTRLQPYARYNYAFITNQHITGVDIEGFQPDPEALKNYQKQYLDYGLVFLNARKRAMQNIYPKYSQYLSILERQSIDGSSNNQLYVNSEWTFPGLFLNHNLVVQASYQSEKQGGRYSFGDNFVYSRGYNPPPYDNIYKIGANYHFPIVYPDLGFFGILYIYRIRGNAFFDFSQTHFTPTNYQYVQSYNSTGGEVVFDTQLFNVMSLSFGVRYSYLLNEDYENPGLKSVVEFFVPITHF